MLKANVDALDSFPLKEELGQNLLLPHKLLPISSSYLAHKRMSWLVFSVYKNQRKEWWALSDKNRVLRKDFKRFRDQKEMSTRLENLKGNMINPKKYGI